MRQCLLSVAIILFIALLHPCHAQNGRIGIGTTTPRLSSILDVSSTTKGVLLPRMTLAQRNAITTPDSALLIYQVDETAGFYYYLNGWQPLTASPAGNANRSLSNLQPTLINADLVPDANDARSIGTLSTAWRDAYFGGDVFMKNNRFISVRSSNIFVGSLAGNSSITGNYNTGLGQSALAAHVIGNWNTANGYQALTNSNNAYSNTATGYQALMENTTGNYNTANGVLALGKNTTGQSNSAFGVAGLNDLVSGSFNSAFGYFAGAKLPGGNYNTYIGAYADGPTATSITNATAIGYNAAVTASNSVRIGNTSVTSIGGQVNWTAFSDGRYKNNVSENVPGLQFINDLRPVTYNLDVQGIANVLMPAKREQLSPVGTGVLSAKLADEQSNAIRQKTAIKYTGFIAQEVETAAKKNNYVFSGVDVPKNDKDFYGLRYAEFVVPLVKAVQELNAKLEEKDATILNLQQQVEGLKLLQKQIDELKAIVLERK